MEERYLFNKVGEIFNKIKKGLVMKKIIILASLSSFIKQFEKDNIEILKKLGYKVFIASNTELKEEYTKIQGIEVYNLPLTRFPLSRGNLISIYKLFRFIKINKIDYIDCHTPTGGLLGRILGKICRVKKVIYTAHGFHFFKGSPLKNWMIYYPIEYILSFFTDILITINNEDYNLAKKKLKAKQILKIPGVGLNTSKFQNYTCDRELERKKLGIDRNDIILLSVGELSSRKNHQIVIKVLGELKKDNIKYLIIGEGKDKELYKNLIEKYSLEKNVILLGRKNNIELYCKISDIFIHPSIREGLGIAALEGMASGLPLIAADINGIKDYAINQKTGLNVEPTNIDEIKKAILTLSNNKKLRNKYGEFNLKEVRKFDLEETNKIMRKVYLELGIKSED